MKFQNPTIHRSKVNGRTHTQTDRQTDRQTHRQAKSNMPFQLFQSWGHNNDIRYTKMKGGGDIQQYNLLFKVKIFSQ